MGAYEIYDWISCPDCDANEERIGIYAYPESFQLTCHECGREAEFVVGRDPPLHKTRLSAIERVIEEKRSPSSES